VLREDLVLTPYQQDFKNQMETAEKVMKKDRNVTTRKFIPD
jgi:hypothetical protein